MSLETAQKPSLMRSELIEGDYVDPRELGPGSDLRDLIRAYLQELRGKERSPRTIDNYAAHLGALLQFLEPTGGRVRVGDLDLRTLKAFSSHLARRPARTAAGASRRPLAASTRNLHLSALRGLLRFGLLLDLPVPAPDKLERARAVQPDPDARHLERSRLERLLEAPDLQRADGLRTRALLELLAASGCRISEVIALDRAQLEGATTSTGASDGLRVADEFTVFGKGGRFRKSYLSKRAREWVQRYLDSRRDRDPALFVTRRRKRSGSYRMSVWMAEHSIAKAARRAGLTEKVTPHWLRHAAITTWATDINLPAAQRLAGHRQIATTSRYIGTSDAELKALYKKRFG